MDELRKTFTSSKIITKQVDVTNPERVSTVFFEAAQELGSIDVLCCFAGIVQCGHAMDLSPQEWSRTLNINTSGEFFCAQAAARHMKVQGRGGAIVLIASISAHRVNFPQPQVAYNVAKSGLLHMAHSLAAEWAVHGIRVNSISPGYMDTILNQGSGLDKAKELWYERNPMGRMGKPWELTGPLVLLCSRWGGAYMTGTDLCVDGTYRI